MRQNLSSEWYLKVLTSEGYTLLHLDFMVYTYDLYVTLLYAGLSHNLPDAEQSVRLKGNHSQCSSAKCLTRAVRRPWELDALQRKEANASAQSTSKLIKHPQHFHYTCTALRWKFLHSKKIPKLRKHTANAKVHKHCRTVLEKNNISHKCLQWEVSNHTDWMWKVF